MNSLFYNTNIFVVPEAKNQAFSLTGSNKKKTLVIIQVEENKNELLAFLKKILEAVKLNMHEDIHFINTTNKSSISFSTQLAHHKYEYVISFGKKPTELGIQIDYTPYQPINISGIQMLFVEDLQTIFEERQKGGKQKAAALWKAMQSIF